MGFFKNTPIIVSRRPPPQLVSYIGKRKVKTYNTDRSPCEPWLPACLAAGPTGCRNHVNNIIICHTHGVLTNSRNSICLCFHLVAQSGFVDLQISQPARAWQFMKIWNVSMVVTVLGVCLFDRSHIMWNHELDRPNVSNKYQKINISPSVVLSAARKGFSQQ